MAEVLGSVGTDATRPQLMARHLGLDKNLAWKVSRIVTDDDLLSTVLHLPGRPGIQILLSALQRIGASPAAMQSVSTALAELDDVVKTHCGDRSTLQIMLGHLNRENQISHDEAIRKKAFLGNSAIWGVQARARLCADFLAPSRESDSMLDMAFLSGLVDFRRLRPNTPWAVATVRRYAEDGTPMLHPQFEPIDLGVGAGEVPLVRELCSQPLPPVSVIPGPNSMRFEIGDGPIGNTANLSCVTGWIVRSAMSRYRTPEDTYGEYHCALTTPSEIAIIDFFVHRSIGFPLPPSVHMYSQLPGGPVYPMCGRDQGELPMRETLISLGSPPDVVTPEFPAYRKLAQMVTERLGWPLNEFVGYRLKIRYPPIPTVSLFRHEIPPAP
jgi:hypothetical protein